MALLHRWDDVRLFLELFRARTLKGAAQRLQLDTSTASRRLAALEVALDVRLFERSREGLTPTAAAEQLLHAAEDMEQAAQVLSATADQQERAVEGLVKLSVPPGFAEAFLAPMLLALSARHPRLRFEVEASIRVVDLGRREADLALRTVRPQAGDLVLQKLADSPWVAMASPAHAARLGAVRDWEALPWVGWGESLGHLPPARWLAQHVKTAPVLRTNAVGLQMAAVALGKVALLPVQYSRSPALAPVRYGRRLAPSAAQWPRDELWLVTHRALRQVPRVRAVWEALAEGILAGAAPTR